MKLCLNWRYNWPLIFSSRLKLPYNPSFIQAETLAALDGFQITSVATVVYTNKRYVRFQIAEMKLFRRYVEANKRGCQLPFL